MKQRIITGALFGIVLLSALYVGSFWFQLLVLFAALVGWKEYTNMIHPQKTYVLWMVGAVFLIVFLFTSLPKELLWFSSAAFFLLVFTFQKERFSLEQTAMAFLGLAYVGFGFYSFSHLRLEQSFFLTLFPLILIWATDSGAYFAGRAFGKHKLAPTISPNKTIEGSVGGIVIAIGVACVYNYYVHAFSSWTVVIILAGIVAILTQIGDLIQSALKRQYDIKDTGTILPGHGGILDRFDSLLFVMPFYYLLFLPYFL